MQTYGRVCYELFHKWLNHFHIFLFFNRILYPINSYRIVGVIFVLALIPVFDKFPINGKSFSPYRNRKNQQRSKYS